MKATANYIVSQFNVWGIDFPGSMDNSNVKWRAVIWIISEAMLVISIAINYLPPRLYSAVFKFSVGLMMLDFFLCLIWLPIGVHNTYGFRTAKDVFTMTCACLLSIFNYETRTQISHRQRNGSPCRLELDFVFVSGSRRLSIPCLMSSSLFTAGTLTGFDASGHIAEETKNAR